MFTVTNYHIFHTYLSVFYALYRLTSVKPSQMQNCYYSKNWSSFPGFTTAPPVDQIQLFCSRLCPATLSFAPTIFLNIHKSFDDDYDRPAIPSMTDPTLFAMYFALMQCTHPPKCLSEGINVIHQKINKRIHLLCSFTKDAIAFVSIISSSYPFWVLCGKL